MKVTAPDGTRWKVGRQWWPDRRLEAADPAFADVPSGTGGDGGWQVVGFRSSGQLRDDVAEALRAGRPLPPATPPPR